MRHTMSTATLLAAGGLALLSPTSEPGAQPALESGRYSEVTEDGLHRVARSAMDAAWVKPDLNLTPYSKLLALPTGVSFRTVEDRSYRARRDDSRTEFPVSDEMKIRMRSLFRETFNEDLAQAQGYEATNLAGPDVLAVQAFLVDVVSHFPPDQAGHIESRVESSWEAAIVLELRDSMSHAILARTVERERVRPEGGVEAAAIWAHTQQLVRRWSQLLCTRLDELSGLSRI